MDSFFARDIQRLFAFRDPDKFNGLFEFVMKQSGGLLEITRTAGALGMSRPTVESHLRALETTHAVTLLRPFHGGGQKEIIKTPKAYAFDTGFVSFSRGWDPLRSDDYGVLWEHLVLEFLQAHGHDWKIQYWRDASGREVDFVIPRDREKVDAIECKWDPEKLDPAAIKLFRSYYPKGDNYLVSPLSIAGYAKKAAGLDLYVCNPDGLRQRMKTSIAGKKL
jgi:predicted AAA+ superfamily ATPase